MTDRHGYLIDTNVISELVRASPDAGVLNWLASQNARALHLSVITLGELAHGIARLPGSSRRDRLESWMRVDIREQFSGRMLDFGEAQAIVWGHLRAKTGQQGSPRGAVDLQIAATASVAGLALVTRNTRDFDGLGIAVFNPWANG